jgi:hypothetical protein
MKSRYRFALNLIGACGILTLPANGANPFSISVTYTGDPAYESYFTSAAAYWERLIPSYIDGNQGLADFQGIAITAATATVDGIGGNLASAGPTFYGTDDSSYRLATAGNMTFDVADAAAMGSNLGKVVLHEMAHVIGIGTLWGLNGLYDQINAPGNYTGANGLAGYNAEFGQSGTSVPVELGGGTGTAHGHWNEVDGGGSNTGISSSVSGLDMRYELMTGWINPSDPFFVSNTTRGGLRDLGYDVQNAALRTWNSTSNDGAADWQSTGNWTGTTTPTKTDIAKFDDYAGPRSLTLDNAAFSAETLQLANSQSVLIQAGTLDVWNINATSSGTTTFQDVTLSGSPNISVSSGSSLIFGNVTAANLLGGGTIGGNVTVAGVHSIGGFGPTGTQTFSNSLSYSSGSIFEWNLNTATNAFDSLVIGDSGSLTVANGAVFKIFSTTAFTDSFWNTPRSWSVMDGFDMSNFSLAYVANSQVPTSSSIASEGFFSFTSESGSSLVWTPVPEPTSALSGLLIAGGLWRRRRS